ncbi:NADH-quinone oxidoreductase subunit NuoE [Legionella gresilensis]|uniref:NADH-quinone oxidoreductase subunit NuoE n=1 Tax=Legionella gresilensis TaxID=91823 RepID=UPI001040F0CF|nr:NADH-quinone oxidoreductase subunit NuoE [Legionella gresilensis]
MSQNSAKLLCQFLTPERIAEIDSWIAKYPPDQKQSAVMSALHIVQDQYGYLTSELMDAVADYLDMPAIAVYEVSTFYSMYEHKPTARNIVNVCTNISCQLRGSAEVVDYLQQKLGVKLGQVTADGRFTIRSVECLGACINAPMMQVNKDYHENLTKDKIDQVLEQYS